MNVTWLGQAGLLFESDSLKIMVDPYLSDSCGEINPKSKRRVAVDRHFFDVKPDVIILTHDHLDHTDEQTLEHFLTFDSEVLVLASGNAWNHVRKRFGGNHNYVMFNRHTEWTTGGVNFRAVMAVHSDTQAIGVIIDNGEKIFIKSIHSEIKTKFVYNNRIFLLRK